MPNSDSALINHVNDFKLPHRIRRLSDLAYNLWWTWNAEAGRVFRSIDPVLWEVTQHNPVRFLREVSGHRLKTAMQDGHYLDRYDEVVRAFDTYMKDVGDTWYAANHGDYLEEPIAYLSTEFGLHESLPFYAGGLGVLSGDHLKEASDLGLPLIAVGFLYTQGYFKQHITEDGWQVADYTKLSFPDLPVHPVMDDDGNQRTIMVELPGRPVHARLWRVQVGKVPLILLDTNVGDNNKQDRELSARLYTSDPELRIAQEFLLGIGGVQALRVMGYNPRVWHMNEGHSAFLALERARELVAAGKSFDQAMERVKASTIFTTHTPVPAGHDEFPVWLMDKYFSGYRQELGLDREKFLDLARQKQPWGDTFSMAVLAMRTAAYRNGVSRIHEKVAREMWSTLWPDRSAEEVPLTHITNGVHTGTWIARRLRVLFDRYFPEGWQDRIDDPQLWESLEAIPDEELWEVRKHLKRKLVALMRERVRQQWIPGEIHPVQVVASGVLLDPYALTIGFARRFATYKRADLVLHNMDRLLELINRPHTPVQLIFAGKAHPADDPGKQLIQHVYRQVKRAETGGRLVFLEDYDMNVASALIQGVDVWLNTPRRGMEASGTSGQKAALNGVLNLSILDGWWAEGYNGSNGWAIAADQVVQDEGEQQRIDAEDLYRILEHEIIPLYYLERSADDLPGEWLGMMKRSMRTLIPQFSMRRMVKQYTEEMYMPALSQPEVVG